MSPAVLTESQFWIRGLRNADGCILWQGCRDQCGYGMLRYQGKQWRAHRLAMFLVRGGIPNKLQVLHKCDIPACINPEHLFFGTQLDNIKDCVLKNRHWRPTGESNTKAKLRSVDIRNIRDLSSRYSPKRLAMEFNISRSTIYRIIKNNGWRHINDNAK